MESKGNSKVIGAFVVGAIVLIVIIFLLFGTGDYFTQKFQYVSFFRGDVDGLKVGAPVKIRGVTLGSVKKITPIMDQDQNFFVEVIFETKNHIIQNVGAEPLKDEIPQEGIKRLIAKGFRAQLVSQSMVTGQLYVRIDYYPDTKVELTGFNTDLIEIPTIRTKTEKLAEKLDEIVNSFSQFKFDELSRNLNSTLSSINKFINSGQLDSNVAEVGRGMLAIRSLVAKIDTTLGPLASGINRSNHSMQTSLSKVDSLIEHLGRISSNGSYDLQNTLVELKRAAASFKELSDYLQRNPSDLIHGKD